MAVPDDRSGTPVVSPIYPGEKTDAAYALEFLGDRQRHDLVEGFCELVSRLNAVNDDNPLWPLTWLSRRDQHNNSLMDDLQFLLRVDAFLRSAPPGTTASVTIANPVAARMAARLAVRGGWQVRTPVRSRLAWGRTSLRRLIARPYGVAALLCHGFRLVRTARRYPTQMWPAKTATVVISTIFHDHTFKADGPFRDTYFGPLPEWLSENGEKCVVMGQVQGNADGIARAAAALQTREVSAQGAYLKATDVLAAVWQAVTSRFDFAVDTPPQFSALGALGGLVNWSMESRVIEIGLGILAGRATRRALARHPGARVIRMYENNPWERAVDAAAKDRPDPRHVLGYFHCAVLRAHLKNAYFENDAPLYPEPDAVVCIGEEARQVYLKMGERRPGRILAGCDLRNVFDDTETARPRKITRILVGFEGLMKMTALLRFTVDAADAIKDVTFVLRCHPALPLDVIARAAGVELMESNNLKISKDTSLSDDIAACDALLYQGSTVALAAVAKGKPLLQFDGGSLVTDDPIFACEAMKETVRTMEDLSNALAKIDHLSDADYQAQMRRLLAYVKDYAHPVNDNALNVFLTGSTVSRGYAQEGSEH